MWRSIRKTDYGLIIPKQLHYASLIGVCGARLTSSWNNWHQRLGNYLLEKHEKDGLDLENSGEESLMLSCPGILKGIQRRKGLLPVRNKLERHPRLEKMEDPQLELGRAGRPLVPVVKG